MSRGQGRIYKRPGTSNYWLDYTIRGERHLESSGTAKHKEAADLLRERIGQRKDGKLISNPDTVTLADLRDGLKRHYAREGNRSLERALQALAHVAAHFGEGAKALTVTRQAVGAYVEHRLAGDAAQKVKPASRDTVRYEVGVLNTCFSVAVEEGLLAVRPMFKRPPPGAARQGFFDPGAFAALVLELPDAIRPLVRFLHMTGWRSGEATGLT